MFRTHPSLTKTTHPQGTSKIPSIKAGRLAFHSCFKPVSQAVQAVLQLPLTYFPHSVTILAGLLERVEPFERFARS